MDGIEQHADVGAMLAPCARLTESDKVSAEIHSRGGRLLPALALYTILRHSPASVSVDISGIAAGSASLIAMAGSHVCIHEAGQIAIFDPTITAIEPRGDTATYLHRVKKTMISIYRTRLAAPWEQISEWMSANNGAGTWFDAQRCYELGFVDEVYP